MTEREVLLSIIEIYNNFITKFCDEVWLLEQSMGLQEQLKIQDFFNKVRKFLLRTLYEKLETIESFKKYKKCCSKHEAMIAFLIDNGADEGMLSQTLFFASKSNVNVTYSRAKKKIMEHE